MPHIKNALFRYRIIDKHIKSTTRPFPSKEELRLACEEALFGSDTGEHICASTIEKDLFAMRMEMDAPIKYSKRHGGYYYTDPDFSVDDVPLKEEDLDAIRFAASTLLQFKDVQMFKDFGSAIDKIVDRVALTNSENPVELNQFVQFETAASVGGGEYLPPLLEGIQKSVAVLFDYENFNSKTKKRRKVLPLLLKEYRNRWYLISWDVVKSRITTYALDRISELELSTEKITKPNNFDPQAFFKYSIGISTSEQAPLLIRFRANDVASKYLETQPIHTSQKCLDEGEWSTFELHVYYSEELVRQFLSFGPEIVIDSPLELKEEIKKRALSLLKLY